MKKVNDAKLQDVIESILENDETDNEEKAGAIVGIIKQLQDASGIKVVMHDNPNDLAHKEVY